MRRIIIYFMMMLFLMPACSRSKSLYEQKRSLMILDNKELPRNKAQLNKSKKRKKSNRRYKKRRR